jgi:hypothetical protein
MAPLSEQKKSTTKFSEQIPKKKKEGRFKYVLIEAMDNEGNVRHLVRGDIRGT